MTHLKNPDVTQKLKVFRMFWPAVSGSLVGTDFHFTQKKANILPVSKTYKSRNLTLKKELEGVSHS